MSILDKIDTYLNEEEVGEGNKKEGFVDDIEKLTEDNNNFRKVLYTGEHTQLVLMSLKAGEDIGDEIHPNTDQFFRIEEGSGEAVINGKTTFIRTGFSVVIPAGAKHNIKNTGNEPLKVYSLYSPPHHADGTIHKTKEIAMKANEKFINGDTTEK